VVLALLAAACGRGSTASAPVVDAFEPVDPGPAPAVPEGPLPPDVVATVDQVFDGATSFGIDRPALAAMAGAGDARLAWLVADLLRFFPGDIDGRYLADAFEELTGQPPAGGSAWEGTTDLLIAWDLPAPPGYVGWKAQLYLAVEASWAPFFDDPAATVDWRHVSWGGVQIDERPQTRRSDGTETHEMVHDDLGGRRVALAFCTLCRSAQAYLVDEVAAELRDRVGPAYDLRTSDLLRRANKLTYERLTGSLVDTFTGTALSGPMLAAGVTLPQVSVVTSTWGAWRDEHPGTTIVAVDGGIGRDYDLDPLRGRDDGGPIFPIGDVDPRLTVQEQVLGAIAPDGTPIAFPVVALTTTLGAGQQASLAGVAVESSGSGFRVTTADGRALVSHEAFWFAWSQFHPDTEVWQPA